VEERGHPVFRGAAVHRHVLDRINAINDSLIIKKELGVGVVGHLHEFIVSASEGFSRVFFLIHLRFFFFFFQVIINRMHPI